LITAPQLIRMNSKTIFPLIKLIKVSLILFISFQINAQDVVQNMDDLISDGNYHEAIKIGKNLSHDQSDNPELNFKIGYCYMKTVLKKELAIPYLLKSAQGYEQNNSKSEMAILTNFYLGQAYHKNYEFEKALKVLIPLHERVSNKNMLEAINEEIEQCKVGIELKKRPVEMQVVNLGKTINSSYSEHSPVISADESVMIFTSRRKPANNIEIKPDGQYHEDIYLSRFDGAEWETPVSISKNINTKAHEASIGISADGQELFIYSEADGGTILSSKLEGKIWSKPHKLGNEINTRWRETHASISADGRYLYFTSDRPGGHGGLDIYVSKRERNGNWGKPENLGPVINTSNDEESPFIHFDGSTLYFSSKGHPTMGGYDIFYSKKRYTGNWTKPENIGYPVNTTENDAFFVTNPNGKRAYYASYKENGLGSTDIYTIELPESEDKNVVVVNGEIIVCSEYREMVDIEVIDEETNDILGTYHPNSRSGEFLFVLKKGKKYEIIFKVGGHKAYTENFDIDINDTYKLISLSIDVTKRPPCRGGADITENVEISEEVDANGVSNEVIANRSIAQLKDENDISKTYVENIMYRKNNAEYTYFKYNLNRLAGYLKKHRDCRIEIVGYADTQGSEAYNLRLSWRRAKFIYWYLLKKGANRNQLTYRGDGEKNQITVNKFENGSYIDRSLVYNRRVEFKVLEDNYKGLIINQFNIPKIYRTNENIIHRNNLSAYHGKYTIQLGAYRLPASPDRYNKLSDIKIFFTGKYYLYTYGVFDSKKAAEDELIDVRAEGYKTAYVREIMHYFPTELSKE